MNTDLYETAELFFSWLERAVTCVLIGVGIINIGQPSSVYFIAFGVYLAVNRLMHAVQKIERRIDDEEEH